MSPKGDRVKNSFGQKYSPTVKKETLAKFN